METRVKNIRNCARCGGDHERVEYWSLKQEMNVEGVVLTHWCLCPDLGEPVLMKFVEYEPGVKKQEEEEIELDDIFIEDEEEEKDTSSLRERVEGLRADVQLWRDESIRAARTAENDVQYLNGKVYEDWQVTKHLDEILAATRKGKKKLSELVRKLSKHQEISISYDGSASIDTYEKELDAVRYDFFKNIRELKDYLAGLPEREG